MVEFIKWLKDYCSFWYSNAEVCIDPMHESGLTSVGRDFKAAYFAGRRSVCIYQTLGCAHGKGCEKNPNVCGFKEYFDFLQKFNKEKHDAETLPTLCHMPGEQLQLFPKEPTVHI